MIPCDRGQAAGGRRRGPPEHTTVSDVTRIAALLQQFRAEPLEATPVEPMPVAPQSLGADIDVHEGFALMPRESEAA